MNRFRNYVLMAAGFAVLAMVVGVFSAGPAIAQAVRAALVSNVDDPGRIPFRFRGNCSFANITTCAVVVPSVPVGKRLVITHVSGELAENLPGGTLIEVTAGSGFYGPHLPVTFVGSFGGLNYFVFDQPELIFGIPGENPPFASVNLGAVPSGDSSISFYLSGYMLDCTTGSCAASAP